MKTLVHRLGYGLALLAVIVSCSQPEPDDPVIDTSRQVVEVSGEYMAELLTTYETYVESLSEQEKRRLQSYANTSTIRSGTKNGRGSIEGLCSCLENQVSCYARSNISECCACYDPKTQVGLCGLYFGIAFCKVEERKIETPTPVKPSPPTLPAVKVYPAQLKELVDYIDSNALGRTSSLSISKLADFKKILSNLYAETQVVRGS